MINPTANFLSTILRNELVNESRILSQKREGVCIPAVTLIRRRPINKQPRNFSIGFSTLVMEQIKNFLVCKWKHVEYAN
ncbi:Uncharacterised protein r2_g420 [Pycnogonum litorale]